MKLNGQKIFTYIENIRDEYVSEAMLTADGALMVPLKAMPYEHEVAHERSAAWRFFHSGWWVATISLVVALSVLTAIVMMGQGGPGTGPGGPVTETESESGGETNGSTETESESSNETESETEHVHNYSEIVYDPAPGCLTDGQSFHTCACGASESRIERRLGHAIENDVCTRCGRSSSQGLKFTSNGDGTCSVAWTRDCTDKDVIIPTVSPEGEVVTTIDSNAFSGQGLFSMSSVHIPDTVTVIREYAFKNCWNLTYIIIPDSVTHIRSGAFQNCDKLTEVVLPDSVTYMGEETFRDCDNLTRVVLPAGVTSLSGTFMECPLLTGVTLPVALQTIGVKTFYKCESLTEMVIPDGVTTIWEYAFNWCTSMERIEIPPSVTYIGKMAFSSCSSLKGVYIESLEAWCGIDFVDNPLKDAHNLYLNGELVTRLVIPEGVTSISSMAFADALCVVSITIPESVTYIAADAFFTCDKVIELINRSSYDTFSIGAVNRLVEHDGESLIVNQDGFLFLTHEGKNYLVGHEDIQRMTTLTLPSNYRGETYELWRRIFSNCHWLTEVVIPDGVTAIGSMAFAYCESLQSLSIGSTVTYLSYRMLEYSRVLPDIYYDGTMEEWRAIRKEHTWNQYCSIGAIHCTDGTLYP